MNVFFKSLFFKSKKSLWLVAVGILATSSASADVLNVSETITSTYDLNGTANSLGISPNGSIVVNDGNKSNSVYAHELYGHSIFNYGTITATAESNNSSTEANGIFTDDNVTNSNITNGGNIATTAQSNDSEADASGIYVYDINNSSNITNSGTITATAEGNGTYAYASGIDTSGVVDSNITNSGDITTTAEGNSSDTSAYGIIIYDDITNSNITNSGIITATIESNDSEADASGIYTYDLNNSNITNSGTITTTTEGNNSDTYAYASGIDTGNISNSNITNSGIITTTAESNGSNASAYGIIIYDDATDSNIKNSGTITTTAESNGSRAYAYAGGIYIDRIINSNITNSGNITTTAKSNSSGVVVEAYGIYTSIISNSNITNSGNITATAKNSGTYAYASGIDTGDITDSNITNSGTITAKVNNALDKSGYSIYLYNTDLNSTITNTKTGKLYGNLHINGDAKVINNGLIALPYNAYNANDANNTNRAYIGGNLTNTGTIQIAMKTDGNISNTQYSQLKVHGNTTFNKGSALDVNVLNAFADTKTKLLIGEKLKNVVSSDTNLTVNDLTVTDNSLLLDFNYILDGNNIDLDITKGLTVLNSTIQGGGNSNALASAKILDNILNKGIPNSMENFYEKLNTLGTGKAINKAVDSTVSHAAVSNIDASNAIVDNIFGVVEHQGYSGLNSGDKLFREKRVWVKPFGNFGKQKDKNSIHGFDFHATGIGMGADGEYSDNAYVGLGFFYNRANVDVNEADQSSDLDIYTALIYGETPIAHGAAKFRYKASASWQKTDSSRYIALTNETAKADYTSNLYAIDLRVEKDIKSYNNLSLEPMIGVRYKYIHSPSYTESSSVGLNVDSSNTKRLTTYLGSKAHYQLNDTSTLNGKINVGYDAVDDDIAIVSAYSASPNDRFTTNGIDNGRWNYSAAIGYKKELTAQDDVNFNYEYYGEGSSYYNNTISLYYLHRF